MGIKGLFPFVYKEVPDAIKKTNFNDYAGKAIAIDALIPIYQWYAVGKQRNIRGSSVSIAGKKQRLLINHLQGLFFRTVSMLCTGITPIYVFDGKPPAAKEETLKRRRERPLRVKIPQDIFEQCRVLLRLMGVPIIDAIGEAEAQCARMVQDGIAYAVATEDSDALPFGAARTLRGFSSAGVKKPLVNEYDLKGIVKGMKLSYIQFVDFCILLGTDYNDPLCGPKKALDLIRKYRTVEKIVDAIGDGKLEIKLPESFDYKSARGEFILKNDTIPAKLLLPHIVSKTPRLQEIRKYLLGNGLDQLKVDNALEKLRSSLGS